MKKTVIAIMISCALATTIHAQQTLVVQHPSILTELASAAGTLAVLPLALAEGVMVGTAEAAGSLIHGSTQVIVTPAPVVAAPAVVAPAPVVIQPQVQVVSSVQVAPAPVVVAPASPVVVGRSAVIAPPAVYPMTTITATPRAGTTVSVTRPASGYELGGTVLIPVAPEHRVGSSLFVNPYVYRHR
ncbi:MAG: hypothetical protein IKC53_03760 [Lentisphaeria bacterium]|nr:hypothetical protein [Lentisphaeria bacterium]